jgi:hypothetical protein
MDINVRATTVAADHPRRPAATVRSEKPRGGMHGGVARLWGGTSGPHIRSADYAAKTPRLLRKLRSWREDFTYGHEGAGGIQLGIRGGGGKIVQKLWATGGLHARILRPTSQRSRTGRRMRSTGALPAAMHCGFLKQKQRIRLEKGNVAVLGANTTSTDEGILRVMGEDGVGVFTGGWYGGPGWRRPTTRNSSRHQRRVQA